MKIIDEKGRLFGKINLIDLLVLVLVVAVVLAVGWKLVGKKAAASVSNNNHEITFTVLFEDQPIEVAEFAETQIGKQIVNNAKLVSAEITGCEAVSSIRTRAQRPLHHHSGHRNVLRQCLDSRQPGGPRGLRVYSQDERV